MNDKDFKESMDGLPQELDRVYGKGWRNLATLDDLTAADAARHKYASWEPVHGNTEDDTEDRVTCPDCGKKHYPSYHDQELCDECCDRLVADSESKRTADETADETSGRSAYNVSPLAPADNQTPTP